VTRPISDYSVLTFDCYGTLIDWESGIWDALQPVIRSSGRSDITRDDALRLFAEVETANEAATPSLIYPELLQAVHRQMTEALELDSSDEMDRRFGASVPFWPAFRDTADALRLLATRFDLVILSNVDRAGFAASNQRLGVDFDAIYTAEDVGSYKPNPANFVYMLDHLEADLGHRAPDVLHCAQSAWHDHGPVNEIGLDNVWIDRQRLSAGGSWGATAPLAALPEAQHVFFSMAEFARAACSTEQ